MLNKDVMSTERTIAGKAHPHDQMIKAARRSSRKFIKPKSPLKKRLRSPISKITILN